MSNRSNADVDLENESFQEITIVDGPEISGKGHILFGRHGVRHVFTEGGNVTVASEPLQTVELPEEMEAEEIREWLEEDDRGKELLAEHGWEDEL